MSEPSLTLEEVGRIIGVTKERVRQLRNLALVKIRRVLMKCIMNQGIRVAECGILTATVCLVD